MELTYPFIIYISIPIIILLIIIKPKKIDTYSGGHKLANTKYIKEIPYYKELVKKYKIILYSLQGICLVGIILSLILLSRLVSIEQITPKEYSRDILLCMDVSSSVSSLNKQLVINLKDTVKDLNNERVGISIFNTSSVLLVPLTDDYDYVIDRLDTLAKSFDAYDIDNNYDSEERINNLEYLENGTLVGYETRGSSLVGDGLASCIYSFSKLEEDRTRIIIFSTDNEVAGNEIVTLDKAASISKSNNIPVFSIGTSLMKSKEEAELKAASEKTGGAYYVSNNDTNVSNIVNSIEQEGKKLVEKQEETRKTDKPQVPFIILVFSIISLFIINKRGKL